MLGLFVNKREYKNTYHLNTKIHCIGLKGVG